MSKVGIVGAGQWGSALAVNIANAGVPVMLWGRNVASLLQNRQNIAYLPDVPFPPTLAVIQNLGSLKSCSEILLTVPAQTMRQTVRLLRLHVDPACCLVICAKGIERATGMTMTAVLREELPAHAHAVLSGPTFAVEVAKGLPTAATIAAPKEEVAAALALSLSNSSLRLYHSTDMVGVELAGAVKNVIAIACGIVIGKGLGENARAALMTRGLAEVTRLAVKLGGKPETLMGLSGLGDMALSCGSLQSRNFSAGYRIGQGQSPENATAGQLVEGIATSEAVLKLADLHGVEMPVARAVHAILSQAIVIDDLIADLMTRPLKTEVL